MKIHVPGSLPESFFTITPPKEAPLDPNLSLWNGVASPRALLKPSFAREVAEAVPGVITAPDMLRTAMELDPEYLSIAPVAAAYLLSTVTPPEPLLDRHSQAAYRMELAIVRHLLGQSWLYDLVHPTLGVPPASRATTDFFVQSMQKESFHRAKDGIVRSLRGALLQSMRTAPALPRPRTSGGLREMILGGLDRVPPILEKERESVILWIYGGTDLLAKLGVETDLGSVAGLRMGQTVVQGFHTPSHVVRVFMDSDFHGGAVLGWTDHRAGARSAVEWNVRNMVHVEPSGCAAGHKTRLNFNFNFTARQDCLATVTF